MIPGDVWLTWLNTLRSSSIDSVLLEPPDPLEPDPDRELSPLGPAVAVAVVEEAHFAVNYISKWFVIIHYTLY